MKSNVFQATFKLNFFSLQTRVILCGAYGDWICTSRAHIACGDVLSCPVGSFQTATFMRSAAGTRKQQSFFRSRRNFTNQLPHGIVSRVWLCNSIVFVFDTFVVSFCDWCHCAVLLMSESREQLVSERRFVCDVCIIIVLNTLSISCMYAHTYLRSRAQHVNAHTHVHKFSLAFSF